MGSSILWHETDECVDCCASHDEAVRKRQPNKPEERHNSRDLMNVYRKIDKLSQQVAMLASGPAVVAKGKKHVVGAEGPAKIVVIDEEKEQGKVKLTSMVKKGLCCYQGVGVALEACGDAGTDLSKIEENVEKQVDNAKQHVIANFSTILNFWKEFGIATGESKPDHFAEEQWKILMGKDIESIITRVLGDPAPLDGGKAKKTKSGRY